MKRIYLLFPAILILSSCKYDKAELPQPETTCVTDPVKHIVPVAMGDDFFSPQHIDIIAGDTVSWTYTTGSEAHTSTCDGTNGTQLPAGGTTWDSPIMSVGDNYKQAISVAGDYTYYCTIHGITMSGTIHVKPRCH